eukprot:1759611-Amphidinium_carterae.2
MENNQSSASRITLATIANSAEATHQRCSILSPCMLLTNSGSSIVEALLMNAFPYGPIGYGYSMGFRLLSDCAVTKLSSSDTITPLP